jgi:hypothetical protein
MKIVRFAIPVAAGVLLVSPPSFSQTKAQDEAREQTVQLSQVPQPARDSAQKALGMAPTEAKLVSGTNPQEYELEGKDKSGKEVSVHVRADGTVIKTEKE